MKYSFVSLKKYTIVLNLHRREGVIQISYNWSPLIYIANFTSHNFSLRGAGGLFGITPNNETEHSPSKTVVSGRESGVGVPPDWATVTFG